MRCDVPHRYSRLLLSDVRGGPHGQSRRIEVIRSVGRVIELLYIWKLLYTDFYMYLIRIAIRRYNMCILSFCSLLYFLLCLTTHTETQYHLYRSLLFYHSLTLYVYIEFLFTIIFFAYIQFFHFFCIMFNYTHRNTISPISITFVLPFIDIICVY